MTDLASVLLMVVETLEGLEVPYFVGGSVASAAYGLVRTTLDADLVADLQPQQVDPFVASLGDAFYADADMIRDAVERRGSFNVLHLDTMLKVDVFIPRGRAYDRAQFQRVLRQPLDAGGAHPVNLASPEDVVLAKLEWYRLGREVSDRQWQDVLGVLRVQGGRIDLAYLRQWAGSLGVADLLERALAEAAAPRP